MPKNFYTKLINTKNISAVIKETGFDEAYVSKITDKYEFNILKIHNLSSPQANILKQLALSLGTDAAVHREVITCNVQESDVIIGGSNRQLKYLAEKLKKQPFSLAKLADEIINLLTEKITPLKIRDQVFNWDKKTYIMGILNVTPDSFSDGGQFDNVDRAIERAGFMIKQGADIIDVGGESTRPFAENVAVEEELNRIIPVIERLRELYKNVVISIDTRNAITAEKAIVAGADIINDVSGFDWDPDMLEIAVEKQVPYILMHTLSDPKTMQIDPKYKENVIGSIYKKLADKINIAVEVGIKRENIIIDPGIGFGKALNDNYEIIRRLKEFTSLKCPVLMGLSRKSLISNILDLPTDQREEANIALNTLSIVNGANIIRVHDVEKHAKALKVLDFALKNNSLS